MAKTKNDNISILYEGLKLLTFLFVVFAISVAIFTALVWLLPWI